MSRHLPKWRGWNHGVRHWAEHIQDVPVGTCGISSDDAVQAVLAGKTSPVADTPGASEDNDHG